MEKTSIKYSECVSVALFIQHAMHMRRITRTFSSVACMGLPYFSHYLINGTIFGKTPLNMKFVF